ncbi:DNA methyltransferase [Stenotrophomonas sp. Betaine-02u-21]|uniref:HsdM family class I SAM-dependent methyltransferase n=1 Tax=unclassified Stenotrophomonas TaxID=196198 RepID=UPI000C321909|nr:MULTISPECIES: class I SAM-dependent DNA methyltransferase [unclassified Stenotrophomonas]PKH69840.1 DNA methyltransferase [Stenotrophomonas sp. Betaine-02u-23]PKH74522.1 DNA methyltransferase [Stenotrophomonas sp. Betaine-02u-21]PKH94446.1 DNA methyltransferase [Stenotrophomonas sp. Bg11-02]
MNIQQLESDLWQSADDLRANSKLTASEYSMPVLGLIFLRHASNRFNAYLPGITAGIGPKVPASRREALIKLGFQGKAAIYLPEAARFENIAALPAGPGVGEAIDAAMDSIEAEHEVLRGALPRGFPAFEPDLLARLIKVFDGEAIRNATGDVFGRIYEYFLNKFAMTGAQEGGEFFTPPSLVRMIVNVIEPDHGLVLDPACGSAGMFVQSGHFIEGRGQDPLDSGVVFHGQEKSDTNTKLARMNLAVHGLDASNIRQGNTFYDQIEPLIGECDFVMANPPFNVDGVETKKVESQVALGSRLPFGLPGLNAKTGAISNANSLWIQYFHSYLNPTGRAGFVMASSASDAGNKDKEIREKLVRTGDVDVMVAIGNKFFYTRSLPCTLWFFDKGKPESRRDTVLMLDARNVYTVVSARSHVFTEEQLANLNAVVWLYRGEGDRFAALVASHQQQADGWLAQLPQRLADDTAAIEALARNLTVFGTGATLAELNDGVDDEARLDETTLEAFKAELDAAREDGKDTGQAVADLEAAVKLARKVVAKARPDKLASVKVAQAALEDLAPQLKATARQLEARHKQWLKLLDKAEKELRGRKSDAFDAKAIREARRALLAADRNRNEEATVRDLALEALKQSGYFVAQAHWLLSRFPDGVFVDVPGLCAAVTRECIAQNDWSLTPGRYVGVAVVTDDDEEGFVERMRAIHDELAELNEKAGELAATISANFEELVA